MAANQGLDFIQLRQHMVELVTQALRASDLFAEFIHDADLAFQATFKGCGAECLGWGELTHRIGRWRPVNPRLVSRLSGYGSGVRQVHSGAKRLEQLQGLKRGNLS